ncbi:lytic transglycosylase domain-containing protein [Cupriavidus gilardii]|nr:lytic transglycosylase domain-containing protein [Cupriavidus gilardii]
MADDLDKFVLQYKVELKDSLTRLEQLQEKLTNTNNEADKGKSALAGLGKAHPALGRLTEKAEAVRAAMKGAAAEGAGFTAGLRAMAPAAAIAATALGAVIGAIRLAQKAMREYQEQADLGITTGTGITVSENVARGLKVSSGGTINREGAQDVLRNLGTTIKAAYEDPSRQGAENLKLRAAGINVTSNAGRITSADEALIQLSERLKKMTDEEGAAKLALLGINTQYLQGIKALTPETLKAAEMSNVEAKRKAEAIEAARRYSAAMTSVQDSLSRTGTTLGDEFAPALAMLAELAAKSAKFIEEAVQGTVDTFDKGVNSAIAFAQALQDTFRDLPQLLKGGLEGVKDGFVQSFERYYQILDDLGKQAKDRETTAARLQYQNLAQEALNINAFSQAVQDFAGVIDERQAWAAWAGEIGRAAGLGKNHQPPQPRGSISFDASKQARDLNGTPSTAPAQPATATQPTQPAQSHVPRGKPINNTEYDSIINEAARRYSVDPLLVKKVIAQESGFNPRAVNKESGATGLMQVMPANFSAYGIKDPFDARQNIFGGVQLLKEYLRAAKGDVETALKMYHGGYKRTGWGPNTNAYPGKVLSKNVEINGSSALSGGTVASSPYGARYETSVDPDYQHPVQVSGQRVMRLPGTGESRETVQRSSYMRQLAAQMGVPVRQLLTGGASRGDVQFAQGNLVADAVNSAQTLLARYRSPAINPLQASEIRQKMRDTYQFLQNASKFGGHAMAISKEGGRAITIGQAPISINISGAGDPNRVAETVAMELRKELGDAVNGASTNVKY